MIHATHRFHGRSSLRFVYQRGQQLRGEFWSLRTVRNNRQATWRLAVVVGRKVHKSAVVRNRIRRRIFEAVRLQAGGIQGPYDLVFIVHTDHPAAMQAAALHSQVAAHLQKAGVFEAPASDHGIVRSKET